MSAAFENFSTRVIAPDVSASPYAAEIVKMLPKYGARPIVADVIMRGCNLAIANGVRRVLLSELPVRTMQIVPDTFSTDDPFLFVDMIETRVSLVPIDDNATPNDRIKLDVENTSGTPLDVMSAELRVERGTRSFAETIPLLTLQPRRYARFEARIVEAEKGPGVCSMARLVPLDQRPIDERGDKTALPLTKDVKFLESCSVSDPRTHLLTYESTGYDPRDLLRKACSNIIDRMHALHGAELQRVSGRSTSTAATEQLQADGSEALNTLRVPGETYTIGAIFMKCCVDTFPDIDAVNFVVEDRANHLLIRIKTVQDARDIIKRTVGVACDVLEQLRASVH